MITKDHFNSSDCEPNSGRHNAVTSEIPRSPKPDGSVDPNYVTRYSRYGRGFDVRATYAHLPFQPFWTWLTGKHLTHHKPRKSIETLLSPLQLGWQLMWSWSVIFASLSAGYWALHATGTTWSVSGVVLVVVWVLVSNRTQGLAHTFHYTNHGASISSFPLARFMGRWFMSIPILYLCWENYQVCHAHEHHANDELCIAHDPGEIFITNYGFYRGMPERKFWVKVATAPFNPKNIWAHIVYRLRQNFRDCSGDEIACRSFFWITLSGIVIRFNLGFEFAVLYLFPLLILAQSSSWLPYATEHLWFAKKPENVSRYAYYGSLSWGKFQGRPYPIGAAPKLLGFLQRIQWWILVFTVDLPIKIFSFMQDLPSHDYHQRAPKVNFWSISRERAANEGLPSQWGPMTETWGLIESWKILRDHVCYGEDDPFGILEWAQRPENHEP